MAAQSGTGTAIETTEGGGLLGQVEVHSIDWIPDPERHGKTWQQSHAVVPRQLPVLHHPHRLRRPVPGPLAGLLDPGRHAGHLRRHPVHGLPRHPGPGVRAAPDDPDPGPAGLPRRGRSPVRRAVHLHGVQRGRPGADEHRPARRLRLERRPGGHRHRRAGRAAGHLRLRLGAPGVPLPAGHLAPLLCDHLGRDPGRARRGHRAAPPGQFRVRRVHGPVLGRGRVQHHLRALRLGLLAVHAAGHLAARHHHRRVLRRLRLGRLADRDGRVAGHPAGRHRRPGRASGRRGQGGRPARLDHRRPVGHRPAGHHGHERLRRHAHRADRDRLVPQDHDQPGLAGG